MIQALRIGEEVSFKIAIPPFERTGIYLGKNPENKKEGLIALENGEDTVSVLRAEIIKHKFPNIKRLNDPDDVPVFKPINTEKVVQEIDGFMAPDFFGSKIIQKVKKMGGKIIGATEEDNGSERPTFLHGHGWQEEATLNAARLMIKVPGQEHPHPIVITSCTMPEKQAEEMADITGRSVYFSGDTNEVGYTPPSIGFIQFRLPMEQHWNRVSPKGDSNENRFSTGPKAITLDLGKTGRTSSLPRTGKGRKL